MNGINAVAGDNGVISALAIDQRGSLQKAIDKAKGSPASDADLRTIKMLISEVLTPYASAILFDPGGISTAAGTTSRWLES